MSPAPRSRPTPHPVDPRRDGRDKRPEDYDKGRRDGGDSRREK